MEVHKRFHRGKVVVRGNNQYVTLNKFNSSYKSITIGVSQGSILGPLLFTIYINNLSNATLSKPRLFADNTCLIINESSCNVLESTFF